MHGAAYGPMDAPCVAPSRVTQKIFADIITSSLTPYNEF